MGLFCRVDDFVAAQRGRLTEPLTTHLGGAGGRKVVRWRQVDGLLLSFRYV